MAAHSLDLSTYGITVSSVRRNPCPAKLYEHAILFDRGTLIAYSGAKTGRSPKDRRVVEHPDSKDDIWGGAVDIPLSTESFGHNRARAVQYLNSCPRIYVIDAYTGCAGSAHGTGSRIKLEYSRAIVDAINTSSLRDAPTQTVPIFKFETVTQVPGVPGDILVPRNARADQDAYDTTASKLAGLFHQNFQKYADGVSPEVLAACPG